MESIILQPYKALFENIDLQHVLTPSVLYGTIYPMKEVIAAFDEFLKSRELSFEAILIGGAVLNILDISSRKTKDVDCLDPELLPEIKMASEEFAEAREDLGLNRDWLNNGPQTLKVDLPRGWRNRIQTLYKGKALKLHTLGREDFLKSKLYAYCDRTTPDFEDLKDLKPTKKELVDAIDWVKQRDTHSGWPAHVEKAFNFLMKALGYD